MPRLAKTLRLCAGLLAALLTTALPARAGDWTDALEQQIARIDRDSPGTLGVYVKRLDDGKAMSYGGDKPWYLSSTAKVPIAITVLQQVDAGKLRLADMLTLQQTDKVDGSGQLVWSKNGSRYSVDSLLNRMLWVSDNTAANMLIRTVGEDRLNTAAKDMLGRDFKGFTNFTEVRRQVYGQIHPDGRKLSNQQLVEVAAAPMGPARVTAVRQAIGQPEDALQAKTVDEAYARYYGQQFNTATLEAYGGMLEQLVRGKLLSPQSTQRLFVGMKLGKAANYRLEAGLPRNVQRIHKTGTQYRRACHMAVVNPQDQGAHAIVIATCAADLDEQKQAGPIFERIGRAVSETMLASQ